MRTLAPFKTYGVFLLLSVMVLSACHGSGGGSTVVATPPLPTVLTVGTPVSDTVVLSTFNAYAATVTPGSFYKISITAPTDDVDLNVYDADNTFTHPIRCPVDNGAIPVTSPEDCILIPTGNTLYFGVDGSFIAGSASVYTIDVELLSEKSPNLSIPFSDQTTQSGAGVYSVPVSPGAYTVSITGLTDDADLHVFTDNGTVITSAVCSATTTSNTLIIGKTPEDCTLSLTAGSGIFFVVDGLFSSAVSVQYTALVAPAPNVPNPTSEGLALSPAVISVDTPTTGQVARASTSFYSVSGLTPGSRYTISITGLTDAADLTVYGSDSTFTTHVACSIDNTGLPGTTPESCTLPAPGGTVFFTVVSGSTSGNGAAYLVLVEPGP
jgi:hypothetical protein